MNELQSLLSCRPDQVYSIMRFNCLPASYLHPLRRDDFLPGLPTSVWESPRAWGRISTIILSEGNLTEPFVDPTHWAWSVALLSSEQLCRLARYAGAILVLEKIRSSLAREHVLSWKQLVGCDAYQFAMTSASLLPTIDVGEIEFTNNPPEKIGYSVIAAVFKSMPEAIKQRCQLKIPPNVELLDIDLKKARRIASIILDISRMEWSS